MLTGDEKVFINSQTKDSTDAPLYYAGAYFYFLYAAQFLHVEGTITQRIIVKVRKSNTIQDHWLS